MKKITVIGWICFMCFGQVLASAPAERCSLPGKLDSLTAFVQWMSLGDEGSYAAIMDSRKHPQGRLAPEVFRDYIAEIEPQRIHFTQGVDFEGGQLTFWWALEECAVAMGSDTLLMQSVAFFKNREWVQQEGNVATALQFESAEGSRLSSFRLWEVGKYKDTKLSSGKVRFQIKFLSSIPAPLMAAMQKVYPAVFAPELPVPLMKILKKKSFSRISYGGSWDRYYAWNVELPCETEEGLTATRKSLIDAMRSCGYVFHEEINGIAVFRLITTDNTSLLQLSTDENQVLKIRFQACA